jgi:transcriptional regulator with XRE-family HTH domain
LACRARERAQLTVRALAEAAKVSTTTIVDTEHGRRIPGADTLERLAVALHVQPCWLAYGDEDKAPEWVQEKALSERGSGAMPD